MIPVLLIAAMLGAGGERTYDPMNLQDLEDLGHLVSSTTLRVESERILPAPFSQAPVVEDGACVHLGQGRLLTTARYLDGAAAVYVVTRQGTRLPATVVRRDADADLAVLQASLAHLAALEAVGGLGPFPIGESKPAEVVLPTSLLGLSVSVRQAITGREEDGASLVTGATANGVPLFDLRGRLVGLSRQPTADRSRTLVVPGEALEAWLASSPGGHGAKEREETGPRTSVRGPEGP